MPTGQTPVIPSKSSDVKSKRASTSAIPGLTGRLALDQSRRSSLPPSSFSQKFPSANDNSDSISSTKVPSSPSPNPRSSAVSGPVKPRASLSVVSTRRTLVRASGNSASTSVAAPSPRKIAVSMSSPRPVPLKASTRPRPISNDQSTGTTTTPSRIRVKSMITSPPAKLESPAIQVTTPSKSSRTFVDTTPVTPKATPPRLGPPSPAANLSSPASKTSTPRSKRGGSMPMMEHPRLLSDSTAILAPGYRAVSKGESNSVHDSPENFFASSGAPPSMWDSVSMIGGGDEEGLEMITELGEDGDDDEELGSLLASVATYHARKVTSFKRLLEKTQFSSAAQLHALQAEVQLLKAQLAAKGGNETMMLGVENNMLCRRCGGKRQSYWGGFRDSDGEEEEEEEEDIDMLKALKGKYDDFDERAIRKIAKKMSREGRQRLVGVILEASHPGDIPLQILLLQKYLKSTHDILGNLSPELALKILKQFSVRDVLSLAVVSKKWHGVVFHPTLWRYHCLRVTANDPVPVKRPEKEDGWFPLYRSLHHLNSNLVNALPQSILFLNGHSNFVTVLMLRGRRLISGSYDESVRFWELPERGIGVGMNAASMNGTGPAGLAECKKVLKVGKVVSCLDWLIEEEVFVVGFHDVGRVHLFSSLTYTLLQQLSGHLNGIRAVALSSKNLVSAGADKALVCWDWRSGSKIVRFGQQTTVNIGVQIIAGSTPQDGERVVSVTIDGVVRVFSIQRREMISQFKLSELGGSDPVLNSKLFNVGAAPNNMLQWFAAKGTQMTCATKSVILHLQWLEEPHESKNESADSGSVSGKSVEASSPPPMSPVNLSVSVNGIRARPSSSLARSTSSASISTPRRPSLMQSVSSSSKASKSRLSLNTPRTPSIGGTSNSTSTTRVGTPVPSTPLASSVLGGPIVALRAAILTAPPKLVALVETPDVAIGAVDPRKKRVVTATRFSSRAGADRRLFMSTHLDKERPWASFEDDPDYLELDASAEWASSASAHQVDIDTSVTPMTGAWAALEHGASGTGVRGLIGNVPPKFAGLAMPEKNPMSMQLSHEEVVVGCADGTIYVMNFVGYDYQKERRQTVLLPENVAPVDEDSDDSESS